MKKTLLLIAFLSFSTTRPISFSPVFNALGSVADVFVSKGKLSKEHEKMFEDVASSLGIEDRNIQARNSGLLLRLICGYNNALSFQPFNRVYLNDTLLKEMSDEEKRFLMAHELIHHSKHHIWKRIFLKIFLEGLKDKSVKFDEEHGITKINFVDRYLTHGYGPRTLEFSIWSLVYAQVCQRQETEADTEAILQAGVHPKDGIKLLNSLYYPATQNWPLYGKVIQGIGSLFMPILELPIIKQHMPHLVSFDERVEHLKGLESEWQKRHGKKV